MWCKRIRFDQLVFCLFVWGHVHVKFLKREKTKTKDKQIAKWEPCNTVKIKKRNKERSCLFPLLFTLVLLYWWASTRKFKTSGTVTYREIRWWSALCGLGKDSKATDIHLHEKSLVSRLNLAKITKPVGTLLKASKALLNSVLKDLQLCPDA